MRRTTLLLIAFLLLAGISTTTFAQAQPEEEAQESPEAEPSKRTERAERRRQLLREQIDDIIREKMREPMSPEEVLPERNRGPQSGDADDERAVSDGEYQESEIFAAVNPTDTSNIVISAIRATGDGLALPIYYTRDFGTSWEVSEFRPTARIGGDPVFTFDADGTLYFSWIAATQRGQILDWLLLFSRSYDGGHSWEGVDTIFSDEFNLFTAAGGLADKQWMAADHSGGSAHNTLYTVFMEVLNGDPRIAVRKMPPGAGTFIQQSVRVSPFDFESVQFSSIGVDAQGTVHVLFWGKKQNSDYGLWHSRSTDAAASFSNPRMVTRVRFPVSGTRPSYLPRRFSAFPQFVVDYNPHSPFSGHLYAVWCGNDPAGSDTGSYNEPFHVWLVRSSDNGESWSEPMRINDDTTAYRADHFHPSIDVGPGGAVSISWYDGRAAANNSQVHQYVAVSIDGGKSVVENVKVSGTGFNIGSQNAFGIGDYNKLVSTSGYTIPVWSDGRSGSQRLQVYTAFVPIGATSGTSGVERISTIGGVLEITSLTPNPATAGTTIRFRLNTPSNIAIDITDIDGRTVRTFPDESLPAGEHAREIITDGLPSGRYFIRLRTDGHEVMKQIGVW